MKRSGFTVVTKLIGLVRPLTGYMILAIVMGLIGHLCATFITILGGYALLNVLHLQIALSLNFIIAGVVIMAILRGVLRYGEQMCNHYIAFKLLALIRNHVFQALRKLCPAKLEGKDKGNLIALITSDIELLEVFYAHTISPTVIAVLYSIAMCIFIDSFHISFSIIAFLAYAVVGGIVPLVISKLSGDDGLKFRSASGNLSSFMLDSLRGLDEIIQYQHGESRLNEMEQRSDDLASSEERLKKNIGRNTAITNGIILLFDLAMMFCGIFLFRQGRIDFASLLIPLIALMSSFGPCVALANLGSTLQNTFAAGNRVLDILEEEPLVEEISSGDQITFTDAAAKGVTFAYEGETILDNFSLEIPNRKIIGIIGKSGSGKSTLLKLLMRFWDVQKGNIFISNKNIKEINTSNLREMQGFMTQETHLFHDSIRNNLRIAKLDASDDDLVRACKQASIHQFIESLPQGYDTLVGELGSTLSGGERQRIGLARAFLHDAPFLLLDEPTSNLDSLNEGLILKSLDEQRKGKTVVLVSHRQSTMQIADTVYSVENGRMS
ncbi:MAG: amino acid ABC transporter ATP-binding/permease protein [Fastidiosipilaceae bacterium]|jgi:ABC-type transport system involved in cytochrome bd biosynthesis fused ATPase/permease subunit|nr:ABC transporter ATP-binding protein [Clostridiaceae bacterium]